MDDFEEKLNSILSSPETMGQIMAIANSLSGGGQEEPDERPESEPFHDTGGRRDENLLGLLQGIDPGMLERIMRLYQEYTRGGDEKAALLRALRPFLKEERRAKLDKAVQITRISRVIRTALGQFRGGEYV